MNKSINTEHSQFIIHRRKAPIISSCLELGNSIYIDELIKKQKFIFDIVK